MSLVVAIKEKNRIVMGCDSQITTGLFKEKLDNKDYCKIWEIANCNGGLMGAVGMVRGSQVIQCEQYLIDELKQLKKEIDYKYVVQELTEKIHSILTKYRLIEKDKSGNSENYMESVFIFAYKNMAYLIWRDFSVMSIKDYLVIGCGSDMAAGVLENNKNKPARERIKEAIKSCSDHNIGIDNNVIIKTT